MSSSEVTQVASPAATRAIHPEIAVKAAYGGGWL